MRCPAAVHTAGHGAHTDETKENDTMGKKLRTMRVRGSVPEAISLLHQLLADRGVEVLASIDHAAGARRAGLELAEEVVVFFGNPATGTGVMQDDPRAGIDLPLRIVFWDDNGTTYAAYRDPQELADDFDLVDHHDVPAKLSKFMTALTSDLRAEQ